MSKKIRSKIFLCILERICNKQIINKFRVNDVIDCLNKSKPFLSKHASDPKNKNKKIYGKPYFLRLERGLYKINDDFLDCKKN